MRGDFVPISLGHGDASGLDIVKDHPETSLVAPMGNDSALTAVIHICSNPGSSRGIRGAVDDVGKRRDDGMTVGHFDGKEY